MKKPLIAIIAACALCLGLLSACGNQAASVKSADVSSSAAQSGELKVVCATFPAYDWVMQVLGDKADACEVTYLMDSGVDLHSYQPTVQDIAKISDADLFVYVGGESDGWAEDAVKAAANPNLHTVNMLEAVGSAAVEEEVVEGMQVEAHDHDHEATHEEAANHDHDHEAAHEEAADHDHDHEAEAHHHHDGEEEPEYDEHVWLSLKNAQVLVDAIAAGLAEADAANADAYKANAQAYKSQLAELDKSYAAAVAAAPKDTVVFADRFPFRYLVDDYNIKYYAAFVGCSAETEASFETVAFLAKKVDELGLKCVLVIENSDQSIAKTVIQNTQSKDQKILVMDSLQSVSAADVSAGKTYLGAMQDNLKVLTEALS